MDTLSSGPYSIYSLNQPPFGHTATFLADGTVFINGGTNIPYNPLSSAELIDLTCASFAPTYIPSGLQYAPFYHDATLLPDGSVFIDGGVQLDSTGSNLITISKNELYTPTPQTPPTITPVIAVWPSNWTISVGSSLNFRTFDINANLDGGSWGVSYNDFKFCLTCYNPHVLTVLDVKN
jgi:hypothetical protein